MQRRLMVLAVSLAILWVCYLAFDLVLYQDAPPWWASFAFAVVFLGAVLGSIAAGMRARAERR